MKLCEKIVLLRKKAGLSQEAMAEKLGVSRQAVSRWEVGSALPDASNVLQLSKLFSVTADYLLNEDYDSDQDVPAVKSISQKARYNVHRMLGIGMTSMGLLGNLMIYIISRCVKVNAPLRTYDPAIKGFWYQYDSVPRIDYGYFIKEYRLEAIVSVLWILVLAGTVVMLWSVPAIEAWIKSLRKQNIASDMPPEACENQQGNTPEQ